MRLLRPCLILFLFSMPASHGARAAEEFLPVLMLSAVEVSDIDAFGELVRQTNAVMQNRHDVPLFLRAYASHTLGGMDSDVFVLAPSASFAGLFANNRLFSTDPTLAGIRQRFGKLASFGPARYVKAIRFDGTNTPGWLNNFYLRTDQESLLVEQINALARELENSGRPMPFINVFRLVTGADDFTHLVSINTASLEELAALADELESLQWPSGVARITGQTDIVDNVLYVEFGL